MLHIHPSTLGDWNDCARRALARNHPELIPPTYSLRSRKRRIAATGGQVAHKAACLLLTEKMITGRNPQWDSVLDEALKLFDKAEEYAEHKFDDLTPDYRTLVGQVSQIVKLYAMKLLPNLKPKLVEQRFMAPLGGGFFLDFTPDLVTEDGDLRDLKTGKDSSFDLQMGLYSLGLKHLGIEVERGFVDRIERSAIDKQKPIVTTEIDLKVAEVEAWGALDLYKRDLKEFRKAKTPLVLTANPFSNLCNETDCPAFGTAFCGLGGKVDDED